MPSTSRGRRTQSNAAKSQRKRLLVRSASQVHALHLGRGPRGGPRHGVSVGRAAGARRAAARGVGREGGRNDRAASAETSAHVRDVGRREALGVLRRLPDRVLSVGVEAISLSLSLEGSGGGARLRTPPVFGGRRAPPSFRAPRARTENPRSGRRESGAERSEPRANAGISAGPWAARTTPSRRSFWKTS